MYPYQPYPQYQTPYQAQRQVLRANGKASIDAMKLAPNESVLVLDNTAPLVWLCVADSIGNVSSAAYDITPHKDVPPVDMGTLEQRLAALEKKMEGLNNVKSDAGYVEPKQNGRAYESNSAHQTGYEHGAVSKQPVSYASANAVPES